MTPSLLDIKFLEAFAALVLVRAFCPARFYVLVLALGSAALIALASPPTFLVIATITVFILFPAQWCLQNRDAAQWQRGWIVFGIASVAGLLCFYKIIRVLPAGALFPTKLIDQIAALFGFSYFALRAISYLRLQALAPAREVQPWTLLYYTLFPSTITSGPIQKFQDFRAQALAPLELTAPLFLEASYRMTRGFFRKLVLAFIFERLAYHVLGRGHLNVIMSTAVVLLLYLFFYFDFAGYSDLAIGLGMLLGIKPPENFRKPFQATTVSEFWRNWHISLVDWFRENVFIPLGGMRGSKVRAAALAFLIMLLCGAWHGLSAPFLIWGLWHGTALLAEALAGTKPLPPPQRHGLKYLWRVLWTNARVALPSILFLPNTADIETILKGFVTFTFR